MTDRKMLLFDVFSILGILVIAWNIIIAQSVATWVGADTILLHLNQFGEQIFEALTFPLAGFLGIFTLVRAIRRWKNYDRW